MNGSRKGLLTVGAVAVVICAIVLIIKLVSGAFKLAGGLLNTILGVVIVVGLIAIVLWMFSYARKKK